VTPAAQRFFFLPEMLVPAILISLEQSTPSALRAVPPRHRPITPAVNLPCTLANSNRLQNHTLAHGSREYPRAFFGEQGIFFRDIAEILSLVANIWQ
jgi:hypothetical protein